MGRLQALDATLPVVVMTTWGSVESAVEAMRRGARDYVEKPWDKAGLVATLNRRVEPGCALRHSQRLEQENRRLRSDGLPHMIAGSRARQPVLRVMERVGPSDAQVLITGEHGTGKDVVARWLHASTCRWSTLTGGARPASIPGTGQGSPNGNLGGMSLSGGWQRITGQ